MLDGVLFAGARISLCGLGRHRAVFVAGQVSGAHLGQLAALDHAGQILEGGQLIVRCIVTKGHGHDSGEQLGGADVEERRCLRA